MIASLQLAPVCLVVSRAMASPSWWRPGELQSWAYVIGEPYPLTVPPVVAGVATKVQAVDADLGDQDGLTSNGAPIAVAMVKSSVAAIHKMGAHAICYVDAGTTENWRSDYAKFDPSEIGRPLPGWAGEYFINTSDWSTRAPPPYLPIKQIMANRFNLCKEEGFDAIEADNIDAYTYGDLGGFTHQPAPGREVRQQPHRSGTFGPPRVLLEERDQQRRVYQRRGPEGGRRDR